MNSSREIIQMKLKDIHPYPGNPRINDDAVEAVANSIKEFGFKNPILVDGEHVIIAGHTRYKASKRLKLKEVPVIVADDLTEQQVKALRIADNKTSELSDWDGDLLGKELADIIDIDMSQFGFTESDAEDAADVDGQPYSMNVKIPQYEIQGDCPEISDMLDSARADELIQHIEEAEGVTDEEKDFLVQAARRHNVFNYRNIAEYYAHATPEMQRLMEESALVIIDVDDAIANGYATLNADVLDIMEGGDDDEG